LELSKNSWLLAIQFPDQEQPSLYSIEGRDADRLMVKLTAARDRWAKVSGALCFGTGPDADRRRKYLILLIALGSRDRADSHCLRHSSPGRTHGRAAFVCARTFRLLVSAHCVKRVFARLSDFVKDFADVDGSRGDKIPRNEILHIVGCVAAVDGLRSISERSQ
jgi:hypothetical protein